MKYVVLLEQEFVQTVLAEVATEADSEQAAAESAIQMAPSLSEIEWACLSPCETTRVISVRRIGGCGLVRKPDGGPG